MTMLQDVCDSLRGMTSLQLLFAFLAFGGYMFAEGQLVPSRARVTAGFVAAISAVAFVVVAPQWTSATMLVVLAVGLIGIFTATVWALSASLGLRRGNPVLAMAAASPDSSAASGEPLDIRVPGAPTRPATLPSH